MNFLTMKLRIAIVCIFFAAPAFVSAAQSVTPIEAKRFAVNALRVMNEVETHALSAAPENIDSAAYVRKFNAPLNKVIAEWPSPSFAPENKAIEPFQICVEAALTLQTLQFHRFNKMKNPELHGKEAERARRAYFFDQKPRCERSIKNVR